MWQKLLLIQALLKENKVQISSEEAGVAGMGHRKQR
jgi:hypothetical protein